MFNFDLSLLSTSKLLVFWGKQMSAQDRRHFFLKKKGDFPKKSPVLIPKHFNIAQACLFSHAHAFPDAIALMDLSNTPRIWTYSDIADATKKLATVMLQKGVVKGDRIGILLPQCAETMIAHFAAHLIGAVSLPLFVLFGADALKFRLVDSGAKILITDCEQYSKICEIRNDLIDLQQVFLRDGRAEGGVDLWRSINLAHVLPEIEPTLAEDPAIMIYTSGTTGNPKGVLHAHRFLLGHLPCIELSFSNFPNAQDIGWTPADWAWIGGLMDMAIPCFYYRVPLVAKRFKRFTAEAAFELIQNAQVTRAFIPPTALKKMQQAIVPNNIPLISISSGGEPLSPDLIRWGKTALGAEVNELYGQTECNLSVGSARSWSVALNGWIGKPFPGFDVRILDINGVAVLSGQVGQICVHRDTPSMFLKYWNKEKKTTEGFMGDYWLTGDLGVMDTQGYLRFVARDDDIITSSGYRIGPTEIEAVLANDTLVALAAVVAVPDKVRGHIIGAYVTLIGATDDKLEDRLISAVASKLSPHMAPKWVNILDEMPLTATGKIRRAALREKHVRENEPKQKDG